MTIKRKVDIPSAKTIIQRIYCADGKKSGHEYYLTKYDAIRLCEAWLKADQKKRARKKK